MVGIAEHAVAGECARRAVEVTIHKVTRQDAIGPVAIAFDEIARRNTGRLVAAPQNAVAGKRADSRVEIAIDEIARAKAVGEIAVSADRVAGERAGCAICVAGYAVAPPAPALQITLHGRNRSTFEIGEGQIVHRNPLQSRQNGIEVTVRLKIVNQFLRDLQWQPILFER